MTANTAALLLSSCTFELVRWNAEDEAVASRTRVPARVAFRDGRVALGEAADQWFALERGEIVHDLPRWLAGNAPAPSPAFEHSKAETWCAALLRHLREEAVAAGLEPGERCVFLLPDALMPQAERLTAAARVAGLSIVDWIPRSLAVAGAARRSNVPRLLCVLDDLALTLALVGAEADRPKLLQHILEPGLGATARNDAIAAVIEDAFDAADYEGMSAVVRGQPRFRARVALAARVLHEPIFGRGMPAAVEIALGEQVRQVWVSPAEVQRRLREAQGACVRTLRMLARQLPDDAPRTVLLAGERHDLPWAKRLIGEAIPDASFEVVGTDALVRGGLQIARTAAVSKEAPANGDDVTLLVGLLTESADGHPHFDVLFDPRDPRERVVTRMLTFPDQIRIALYRPDGVGGFERLGELHLPVFDYQRLKLEVSFSRVSGRSYNVMCYDPVGGGTVNGTLIVAGNAQEKELVAALASLPIVPPLPAGWPLPRLAAGF